MKKSQDRQNKLGGNWICKDILLWLYWNPFAMLMQNVPTTFFYAIAGTCAFLFRLLASAYGKRLAGELEFIFGAQLSHRQRKQIVREACFVYICNELEVLRFPALNADNIAAHVKIDGMEHLEQALKKGQGAMLLFAHFGANQMVMPAIGYRGYTMNQMSAPATVWIERFAHRRISGMEKLSFQKRWQNELSLPVKHINIFGSLKEAFLCLRRNEILGIAIDGASGREWARVRFLGRDAYFSFGAVDIARRTGCAVLPTFMVRGKNGRNTMQILHPLRLADQADKKKIMTDAIREFAGILEKFVTKHPGHYINFLLLRSFKAKQLGDMPMFPGADNVSDENK